MGKIDPPIVFVVARFNAYDSVYTSFEFFIHQKYIALWAAAAVRLVNWWWIATLNNYWYFYIFYVFYRWVAQQDSVHIQTLDLHDVYDLYSSKVLYYHIIHHVFKNQKINKIDTWHVRPWNIDKSTCNTTLTDGDPIVYYVWLHCAIECGWCKIIINMNDPIIVTLS